jgi:hypothetical protein
MLSFEPWVLSNTLLKIGIVCRRSTTPTTVCKGLRRVSRAALNFIDCLYVSI